MAIESCLLAHLRFMADQESSSNIRKLSPFGYSLGHLESHTRRILFATFAPLPVLLMSAFGVPFLSLCSFYFVRLAVFAKHGRHETNTSYYFDAFTTLKRIFALRLLQICAIPGQFP